jgi:hypothetical protein
MTYVTYQTFVQWAIFFLRQITKRSCRSCWCFCTLQPLLKIKIYKTICNQLFYTLVKHKLQCRSSSSVSQLQYLSCPWFTNKVHKKITTKPQEAKISRDRKCWWCDVTQSQLFSSYLAMQVVQYIKTTSHYLCMAALFSFPKW